MFIGVVIIAKSKDSGATSPPDSWSGRGGNWPWDKGGGGVKFSCCGYENVCTTLP